ncbi:hypothetical protein E4K72_16360 [Oxalobacteraceae bacterium OM1]|nr:hypothetical protein E4K72_16360 [Oxalobacteraceae bacterium OM1]
MTIKREDLVAAASVGLLPYRQIDPLLVFLLQRDVLAKRAALGNEVAAPRVNWASYLLGLSLVVLAALGALVYTVKAFGPMSNASLFCFTLAYTAIALGLASWFRRRRIGARVRVVAALVMAMLPFAVLALQQVKI